jgi:Caspase domain
MSKYGNILAPLLAIPILFAGMKPVDNTTLSRDNFNGRLVYHASSSGYPTLDADAKGGNPFASAFIELLSRKSIALKQFTREIVELTDKNSNGFQNADVPQSLINPNWRVVSHNSNESRIALVLVISDYKKSVEIQSLPGAKFDAKRIAKALSKAGYNTKLALDLSRPEFLKELKDFKQRSKIADAAIIYTTGHGGEFNRRVHLISGDYPFGEKNKALETHAYPLSQIAQAANAKQINMIFYAGCRDNPF